MRMNAGFTMVELIVTMMIIGIMAVAVVPRMSLLGGFSARGYADQIEAYLRFAQKSALAGRRVTRLALANCTPANNNCETAPTLTISYDFIASDTSATACPALGASCATGGWCSMSLPGQFRVAEHRVTVAGASTICFDTLGRPMNSGSDINITFSDESGSLARTVTVKGETGYIYGH